MRLDKYLALSGAGTRSTVKKIIKNKRVTVNGMVCTRPETQVRELSDVIILDEEQILYSRFYYYMLNKPSGVVTAVSDRQNKTVMDFFDIQPGKDLFPVGRLDKDTEGLLLITNDGPLAHALLSPARHIPKTYYVELDSAIQEKDIVQLETGIDIGEKQMTHPASIHMTDQEKTKGYITITEGKYHQVKRMFQAVGHRVLYLKRISMGNLILDSGLKGGEYRALTEKEIKDLREYAGNYNSGK